MTILERPFHEALLIIAKDISFTIVFIKMVHLTKCLLPYLDTGYWRA